MGIEYQNQNRLRKNWKNFIVICTHLKKKWTSRWNQEFRVFCWRCWNPSTEWRRTSFARTWLKWLKEAVSSFSDNKTPGEDGFTKEFYESFNDLIWRDLLNSYNAAFQGGSLSISQRMGIITLIPKVDEDLSELSNWRLITLLNIDYKILTKALAKK